MFLKQSTSQAIRIGPFLDSTDGDTEETGLTIANTDVRLSPDGGNFVAKNSGGLTHDENGWYSGTLNATDTATVGELDIYVHATGALAVWKRYWVLEEAIYDALFGASAAGFDSNQRVDVGSWIGTAVTLGSGAPDVNIASTDDIDLSATQKASVNAECDTALTDYDAVVPGDLPTNFADLSITVTTGRVDVASIEGSDATDQINAAADTALTDYDPPTKAELDSGFAALNDLSAAEVNAEVDTALDTAIPGVPTADSINERVAALDDLLESGGSGDAAAILTDTNSLNDTKVSQTLNLTASGNIGIDWANVENPTTALDLSGTDIQLADTATDVTNRVSANTDQIDGDATAATNLKRSASGVVPSAVNDASATTTSFVTDLTEATDDHYNGRIIVFTSGALSGQATDITDYTGSTKTVTVTALTEAPGNNDQFVIV